MALAVVVVIMILNCNEDALPLSARKHFIEIYYHIFFDLLSILIIIENMW